MKISQIIVFLILLSGLACKTDPGTDFKNLPVQGDKGVRVIIEIPAGTNHKIEIDKETGKFENDQLNGKDRIVDFLPYPGNYGFIPNTIMDKASGGDGDALDVLVISESMPTGTNIQVIPIAALMMVDEGEQDTKIIAVPADSTRQVMKAIDFQTFMIDYSMAQNIIQDWFLNYKGLGKVELKGWRDEQYAMREIEKWTVKATK